MDWWNPPPIAEFESQLADLLGELKPKVVRADLGTKGVFFGVRAGPLGDAAEARALCVRLKARQLACYVVRP